MSKFKAKEILVLLPPSVIAFFDNLTYFVPNKNALCQIHASFLFLSIAGIIYFILFLVMSRYLKHKVKRLSRIALLATFCIAIPYGIYVLGNDSMISKVKSKGNKLVKEIETYKRLKGVFPNSLSELSMDNAQSSGLCIHPDFTYSNFIDQERKFTLSISTGGLLSMDELIYTYIDKHQTSNWERIGY